MTKKKIIIFSVITWAILLLVLEVIGRVIYPFDPVERAKIIAERDPRVNFSTWENASGQTILEDIYGMEKRYLSFLGFLGAPNTKKTTLETNEIGFRDSTIEPRKPNEYRILLLGGSTAWGWGASDNEHTIAGALQNMLNEDSSGTTYRVMNGAYQVWTSLQERITLMEFYELFDPDLVISFSGYNDIISVQYGNSRELLRLEYSMVEKAVEENLKPMDTMKAIRKFVGSLGVWRLVVYFRELFPSTDRSRINYKPERSAEGFPKVVDRYASMAAFTNSHNGQYLLVLQPDIYTTGKKLTPAEEEVKEWEQAKSSENFENTFVQYRADLVDSLTELSSAGVEILDYQPVFDSVDGSVFTDVAHFNDSGFQAVAQALHDVIIENYSP